MPANSHGRRRFLQRNPPPVIIDEVQYARACFGISRWPWTRSVGGTVSSCSLGSQKFTLMRNVSESLAGRADIVELETLSFAEIREAMPEAESKPLSSGVVSRSCMPTWISTR